jgi:hypothetical protein
VKEIVEEGKRSRWRKSDLNLCFGASKKINKCIIVSSEGNNLFMFVKNLRTFFPLPLSCAVVLVKVPSHFAMFFLQLPPYHFWFLVQQLREKNMMSSYCPRHAPHIGLHFKFMLMRQ